MNIDDCVKYLVSIGYKIKEKDFMKVRMKSNLDITNWFKKFSDKCVIENVFQNIKKIQSNTSSDSSVFFAKLTLDDSKEVAVKLSYTMDNRFDNGTDVEIKIYEHIIPKMIYHTPFLLYGYSSYKCKDTKINKKILELYKDAKINRDIYPENNDVSNFLVLEKTSGNTFSKTLDLLLEKKNKEELNNMLISVVFQVLWTLKCLSMINMTHNDLHQNNIFLEVLPQDISLYFKINKKIVRLKTKYFVKIYDFDRSCVIGNKNIYRNMLIDDQFCINDNECNYIDNKKDVFKFLSDIYYDINKTNKKVYFMTYLKKVIFNHKYELSSYSEIPDWVLKPLDTCIDELLNYNDTDIIKYVKHKNKNIYTLPKKVSIKYEYPISNEKHLYKELNKDNKYSTNYSFYNLINSKQIFLLWNFELEKLYKFNWNKKSNELYDDIMKKSKGVYLKNNDFYKAVILMSCPMFHKLIKMDNKATEDEKGYIDLLIYKLNDNTNEDINVKNYINYIWNLYNNKLNFKVPCL